MLAAPMARLQQKKQAAVTTGSAGTTRHSPRNGLRLIRDLPGDRAFLASVALRNVPQDLIPASGDQDHTTSPSASSALVLRAKASIASRAQHS